MIYGFTVVEESANNWEPEKLIFTAFLNTGLKEDVILIDCLVESLCAFNPNEIKQPAVINKIVLYMLVFLMCRDLKSFIDD